MQIYVCINTHTCTHKANLIDVKFWLSKPLTPKADIPMAQIISFLCTLILGENFYVVHIYKDQSKSPILKYFQHKKYLLIIFEKQWL